MDDDMPHRINKLHKLKAYFGIKVTAWVRNPLMLNGIVCGRVSGKYSAVNSLAPAAADIRYAVTLGSGPLVM